MRVLVIAPTPYFSDRGCHIRILEELNALFAGGHNAEVYTYHLGRTVGPAPIHRIFNIPWYRKTSAGPSWQKIYLDILLLLNVLIQTKRGQFDVIHAHLHEGLAIGWLAARWLRLPLVADLQSELLGELKAYQWLPRVCESFARRLQGFLLRKADWIFISSPKAFDALRSTHPFVERKIELLLDGVSHVAPERSPNHTKIPMIAYAGGTGAAKGTDILIDSLEELARQEIPFSVMWVGQLPMDVHERITSGVLRNRCTLTEHIPYEQILPILTQADIGVDPKPPTSTESSGKLLQYMAAGLATVAFASQTTQRLVGNAGVLVGEHTAIALATSMKQLLMDADHRDSLAKKAALHIQDFTWEKLFTLVVQRYETLTHHRA